MDFKSIGNEGFGNNFCFDQNIFRQMPLTKNLDDVIKFETMKIHLKQAVPKFNKISHSFGPLFVI